jgi:hypothetical protein
LDYAFHVAKVFGELINVLDLSERSISLDNFLIPGNKSGEPQIDILDDELRSNHMMSFSIHYYKLNS